MQRYGKWWCHLCTPHDHMRRLFSFSLILLGTVALFSCSKDAHVGSQTAAVLEGRWNVVTDSTFQGIGAYNRPINYAGNPGDYFDFRSNGYLYTNENGVMDTLQYQFTSDSALVIGSFGLIFNGIAEETKIIGLTPHTVTLTAPVQLTPAGEFGRIVHLSR